MHMEGFMDPVLAAVVLIQDFWGQTVLALCV
jgi:hypothetical protein